MHQEDKFLFSIEQIKICRGNLHMRIVFVVRTQFTLVFFLKKKDDRRRLSYNFENKEVPSFEPGSDGRVPEVTALTSHARRSLAICSFC
jgi:hypothetical protein